MPHKLRRIRKKRGSRTVGYGRVGQHRGGGQRGGHGKAGRRKHLRSYILRYEPDYFEKKGFRLSRRLEPNIINVGEVDIEVDRLLDEGKAIKQVNGIHIDLKELGYDKLLGSGKVTRPLVLKVDSFSKSAAKKIKMAKGGILQITQIQPSSMDQRLEVQDAKTKFNLTDVKGIGKMRSEKLREIGINSVKALADCKTKELAGEVGISNKIAVKWIENAKALLTAD